MLAPLDTDVAEMLPRYSRKVPPDEAVAAGGVAGHADTR
ncbi:MAG: hypothetical protein QOE54_6928 [Streptosporangiaceae bacterium]|jgi:hypothetical protein|nr:hypothetical protein [Streptosporangiaceae bacterium]